MTTCRQESSCKTLITAITTTNDTETAQRDAHALPRACCVSDQRTAARARSSRRVINQLEFAFSRSSGAPLTANKRKSCWFKSGDLGGHISKTKVPRTRGYTDAPRWWLLLQNVLLKSNYAFFQNAEDQETVILFYLFFLLWRKNVTLWYFKNRALKWAFGQQKADVGMRITVFWVVEPCNW